MPRMHKPITVNSQRMKMSVCSEFVEHIWKPGFCKNCFHPRSDHQKSQAYFDGKAGNLPVLHSLNGIRIKPENAHQDDDSVIAALYTKPTIAVKPTMVTSESAEMWAELNSTESLTQVSWKMASMSNSILKQSGMSKVILDNFSKPFSHNYSPTNNSTSNFVFPGLQSPVKKMEINELHNLTYVSHFGVQADKGTFIKEKLPVSYDESNHVVKLNSYGDTQKLNCIKEDSALLSLKNSNGGSSGIKSDRPGPRGTATSVDSTACHNGGTSNLNSSIHLKESHVKCSSRSSESGSSNNLHLSKMKVSLHCESDGKSDNLSCNSKKDSPLASPISAASQTSDFHSPTKYRSSLSKNTQQFTHTQTQLEVEENHSEPIYAESTKRKGVSSKTAVKTEMHVEKNTKQDNGCESKLESLNHNKMYQESTTHVAAKITVMAAHTEEDNRTIYLSSPDSAVGVEWVCGSPSSSTERGSLSPTFHWGEKRQEIKTEVSRKFNLSQKIQGHSSSVVPLKGLKPEECTKLSSPTRSSGNICTGSLKKESESNDRSLPFVSGERKPKFYQWTRQCRIDEEEEEEVVPTPLPRTHSVDSGHLAKSRTATCNDDDKRTKLEDPKTRKGMSKSTSCPVELAKVNCEIEDSNNPPPPPPKKQPRQTHKLNKSSSDMENLSMGSVESLGESFKTMSVSNSNVNINISFSTGSIDSLDSKTCSEGGKSCEGINSPVGEKRVFPKVSSSMDSGDELHQGSKQPPPLPVKKSMNRACSAPDNSSWCRAFPGKNTDVSTNLRLNLSNSESNVFGEEATHSRYLLSPGDKPAMFSSSESLETCCRGSGHRNEIRNCIQTRCNLSSSQLSVSSHTSSGSSLQLHHLLSNIDSKEGTYAKLSGLYAQSMRRLVNKCEDHFMKDQKKEMHFNENNWSLFKLTSNKPCCIAGDAIYYCATCAQDPLNNYAVKMCKAEDTKVSPYCSLSLPVHFNIQQDCGHFLATVPSSMLQPSDTPKDSSANDISQTVGPSPEQECVVVITREVPYRTAADFVRDSSSFHKSHPDIYERQISLLLLQLCNGLEHLKEHGIIHRDLCLENLLLVNCLISTDKVKDDKYVPRLIVSNFSKAKQKSGSEDSKPRRDKTRLAPEIMAASQYKKFDEFQTGILIYELLHLPNPFEVRTSLHEQEYSQKDLPSLPHLSVYSLGLQNLAHLLLEADPIKRIRITEAKRILQCLLWGPRKDLTDQPFTHEEALHCALQNWIDMKRALLMMKFAEKAMESEQSISLEDWLCCQYLASADPCYLYKTLKLIKLV
ncbi:inactive tyrosine-protein kinase PRAG1 [Bombina bombina]|uniref:inactive tyrosine-protein kinase PRAG1 n=1 Tax=Bombina bombina TaxID=8345 RepID=UPI00235A755D|nr:inactive tyrosine-protein kinase PRAG1 [Bombina bombina]